MKIALLSDTHGYMDDEIVQHCRAADEIWHAGDMGSLAVMQQLEQTGKPIVAVTGNVDGDELKKNHPVQQHLEREGIKVWIRHIVGNPERYYPDVRAVLRNPKKRPDLLIAGHSHILQIARDDYGTLFINPGAAGQSGFHQKRTMVYFELTRGEIKNVAVVDFGARGQRP
ncbi:MAG: metallophosphoesterase family protein [Deinococcales bacterium]